MVYLDYHKKKYPLMDIQDIIKLHLQGILGPAHLLPSKDRIKENFINEYNEIKDLDYPYDLLEEVSETYTRVYLKPYYELMGNFDKLVDVFYYSIDKNLDIEGYKKVIESLINEGVCCNCKNKIESGFEINFNKRFFNSVKICKLRK